MSRKILCVLASPLLDSAYNSFLLSRQMEGCSISTLEFYYYTCGKFLQWVEKTHSVTAPGDITLFHIRQYITGLQDAGKKDTTVWNNARAIKTMFISWYADNIVQAVIKFDMPKKHKRKMLRLTVHELDKVLKECNVRDRAILVFMSDSGLRRQETINLDWSDVDMHTGLVMVKNGKGGKDRTAVIGARCRRMLLAYRRSLPTELMYGVLFKTDEGIRFSKTGMLSIFRRLTKKTGIHITPHSLRRTWTILSLRSGMDSLYLQHLGGWEDMTMLDHYAAIEDIDLLRAHRDHSPHDNWDKLKRDLPD